jgi:hypothetical protein
MITDELLERGLAGAADQYDVPAGAIDRLRAELEPESPVERRRGLHMTPRTWLLSSAAALIVLIIVAVAIGGGNGSSNTNESAGGSAVSGIDQSSSTANGAVVGAPGTTQHKALDRAAVPAPTAAPLAPGGVAAAAPEFGSNGASGSAAVGGGTTDATGTASDVTPTSALAVAPRIEKTGDMDLQVGKGQVSQTLDAISALAGFYNGIVSDSHTSEGTDPSGQITLRIPVNSFEKAISKIRHLAGVKVNSVETSAQDVTSRYVDLQARIHSLQATRLTYLRILEKANTIGEILSVQQRVNDVQTQIEQLQGQLNVLANQTSLSTLVVSVDQKHAPAAVVHHKSGLTRAVDRSVSRFVHGIEAIIGVIGPILLVLLLVAFGWLVARLGYRRLRRQLV